MNTLTQARQQARLTRMCAKEAALRLLMAYYRQPPTTSEGKARLRAALAKAQALGLDKTVTYQWAAALLTGEEPWRIG